MPAYNMAGPRATPLDNPLEAFRLSAPIANPNLGAPVIMDPFSGPKGSPLDAMTYPAGTYMPTYAQRAADVANTSTGELATGIGFGLNAEVPGITTADLFVIGATAGKFPRNFTDDYTPGVTKPDGTAATDATLLAIGGGRSNITVTGGDVSKGLSVVAPWSVAPIGAFGQGASRDGGAGPAFTAFAMKTVTAAADVADAAVVETGFVNRTGGVVKSGLSVFGSAAAASAAPTIIGEQAAKGALPKPPTKEEDEKLKKEFDEGLKKELEHKSQPTFKK